MAKVKGKLSFKEKLGYSLGDLASNLFFQTFILFITYFYTDVFGLPAAVVGTMFLVTRVWDAVNDPLMGMVADRTETKWGKFRPYLLWGAIPLGIFGVLTFTTPDLSTSGKIIYAYVTYTLMMMAYTAVNVPYSSLMAVITPNSEERTVVSSYRFVAVFVAQLIIQYFLLRLVKLYGGENPQLGWQLAMATFSGLAVILFWISFAASKERVKPPKGQKRNLKQDLSNLIKNKPWVLIALATVFQLIFIVVRNGSIMYYFKYFVQDTQINLFGNVNTYNYEQMAPVFMIAGGIFSIIGAILTSKFSKAFGKRKSYIGFLTMSGLFTALFFFLGRDNIVLMFILQIIASFALGPLSVLQWAIYADTSDYTEWKMKRRTTGLVMSGALFALKLGLALGGSVLGWILALYGFQANQAQTAEALLGIRMVISIYPAIFAMIGASIMFFYPLTSTMTDKIEKELNERREAEENSQATNDPIV